MHLMAKKMLDREKSFVSNQFQCFSKNRKKNFLSDFKIFGCRDDTKKIGPEFGKKSGVGVGRLTSAIQIFQVEKS